MTRKTATLVLDDGSMFHGFSFGFDKAVAGEVVFNTAMTGYPESLTDPSYAGQLMVLTYPLVGNYGVPPFSIEENGLPTFMESEKIHAEAIIVSDYSEEYSHWNAVESLSDWLKREMIPGITGIDTRALTKKIREHGVMMGRIVIGGADNEGESGKVKGESEGEMPDYGSINYVDRVSCKEIIVYLPDGTEMSFPVDTDKFQISNFNFQLLKRVVLLDCGVKANIIRSLLKRNVAVIRVPGTMISTNWSMTGFSYRTVPATRTLAMRLSKIFVRHSVATNRSVASVWETSCLPKLVVLRSIN